MTTAVLASVGLMCLLKYGSILQFVRRPLMKIRFFKELFSCSLCLGFWSGVTIAAYLWYTTGEVVVLLPLVACASAWLFDSVVGLAQLAELALEQKSPESGNSDIS